MHYSTKMIQKNTKETVVLMFECLTFKYLYASAKVSTAIWRSRQCKCVVMRKLAVQILQQEFFYVFYLSFIFPFGFSNSLIIHKCISRVQRATNCFWFFDRFPTVPIYVITAVCAYEHCIPTICPFNLL